jgi:hypothetical protein
MDLGKFLEKLVANTRTLKRVAYAVLALTVVVDFFLLRHHPHFFWDSIPGFSAGYGFIGCVLIIVVSKAFGHYWVARSEDYYDD